MINLVQDTIDNNDIDQLIKWLKTYPKLTKGPVTRQFEEKFANWIGSKHAVFCNSGSSANLLMLSALIEGEYLTNSKIVVPSLAWSTDLAPIMQLGLTPILCDINLDNLCVDLTHLEHIFQTESPAVFLYVSVLGFSSNMTDIIQLCKKYNVQLIEDNCESMGSEYNNQKLGTFGKMSSFSTYFGHHMSTIEGGLITTNDTSIYELLVSLRSHGWDRDLSKETREKLQKKWNISEFNALYTFYYPGYNLRGTDLQAFIGLGQIDKLNDWGKKREHNFNLYQTLIKNDYWTPKPTSNTVISNFAYPIIHPNKDALIKDLHSNNVEVRPLISGSLGKQPFYIKKYGKLELENADIVDKYGCYIPNHPKLKEDEIQFIAQLVNTHTSTH